MKKQVLVLVALAFLLVSREASAQVQLIKLDQVPGEFTTQSLNLEPGQYRFEVSNSGVDHEVGFVLAPQGKEQDAEAHLSNAYLTQTITDGQTAQSNVVTLKEGVYSYFCPLNPTPNYTLIVGSED